MPVRQLLPAQAHRLLPLLHQVHDLHLAHQPARYAKLPGDRQMAPHMQTWPSMPDVYALGYLQAGDLLGYVVYEIEHRPATPFRTA
ncbi:MULTISPECIES: hypothetical protein [unclassified Ruegeria]|uniref:hypothetical protein n=1 Tax=unclassified Ruegeria TaxID=2625375 RepID=UPI001489FAD2|nr:MULTISPECIES: hypothetical protein [unclassified Ruegeria]